MLKKVKSFLFENKSARQTVAKNTIWLTISNFGGRAIKAGVLIYAARVLGTAGYGVFLYVITLAGFFTLFIDPGLNNMLMRDVSKGDEQHKQTLLSTMFVMKLVLIFIGILVILFIAPLFSTLPGAKILLPIAALIISLDTLRDFFSAFMRGRERMEWDAFIFLTTNFGILVAGFIFLAIARVPISLMWGYAVGTGIGLCVAVWAVRKNLLRIFSSISTALMRPIIKAAWPFAVTGALGTLLTNADVLIISWILTASDVGIYAAAVRIVQVLYLVPMVFQFSTLPLIGRLAGKDDARFRSIFERTVGMILLASVPLALGGFILGSEIMRFVFGAAYGSGGWAFRILILSVLFDFPLAVVSAAIFSYGRQKSLIVSAAIGGVLNVLFDLILIPIFGIAGSSVATFIAQAATNWYLWGKMKKINYFEIIPRMKKVATAGIVMAAATTLLLVTGTELLVNILVSSMVYFMTLYLLREPLLIEIKRTIIPAAPAVETVLP